MSLALKYYIDEKNIQNKQRSKNIRLRMTKKEVKKQN